MKNFIILFLTSWMSYSVYGHTDTVSIVDNQFVPNTITISEGDTIVWMQNGNIAHTTTSGTNCNNDGNWNSGNLSPGASFMHQFSTAGTYPYFCIPHCGGGMTGEVTVTSSVDLKEETELGIELYPNPVKGKLVLNLGNENYNNSKWRIINPSGAEIANGNIDADSDNKMLLNVSHFETGVYILQILNGDNVLFFEKFSKI